MDINSINSFGVNCGKYYFIYIRKFMDTNGAKFLSSSMGNI